jgi:parallel beta-helix repeat protein
MGGGRKLRGTCFLAFILLSCCIAGFLSSLPAARAISTIYILADGSIYPDGAPLQRNGDLYIVTGSINSDTDGIVIERNDTTLDGAGHSLQGTNSPSSNGIYLSSNHNITIKNIAVRGFTWGILLDAYSTNSTVLRDTVENNDYGISCFAYADNNNIVGNNVTGNNLAGIWIVGSSNDTIVENMIAANSQYGMSLQSSSNGSIYHNDFMGNPIQIGIYDSPSTWDNGYPSGGNYWSDYTGQDLHRGPLQDQPGSDGIGDTPYSTSESSQDNYPLMQVFENIKVQLSLPPKTIVGQGYSYYLQIQLENQGWDTQTTSLTIYIDTNVLSTFNNIVIPGIGQMTLNSTWQTSTYVKGNHTIAIIATPIPAEVDTTDDSFTWTVHLGVPGDVSSINPGVYDQVVNMKDIAYLVRQFNTRPSSTTWNPNADINDDTVVNMRDIAITIRDFNQHE